MGVQLEVLLEVTWRPGFPLWVEYWTSAPAGICREQYPSQRFRQH